jgi:hypothetical protein
LVVPRQELSYIRSRATTVELQRLDSRVGNPYLRFMDGIAPMPRRAVPAVMLILCLTIAPLCAARCSTQLCLPSSSATGNSGGCHESSDDPAAFGWKKVAPHACAPAELVFTSPRNVDHLSSHTFSPVLFLSVPFSSREATAALNSNTSPDIAESVSPLAATTVLRL